LTNSVGRTFARESEDNLSWDGVRGHYFFFFLWSFLTRSFRGYNDWGSAAQRCGG
jgi:hypothetical protein